MTRLLNHLPPSLLERAGRLAARSPRFARVATRVTRGLKQGEVTIPHGAGAGLRFDPAGSMPSYALGTAEPAVQTALKELLRPGMTMFDVGANVGFMSVIAARLVGPGGRVVGFEPVPENAAAIRRNAAANGFAQIEVVEVAAGAAAADAPFARRDGSPWGSLVDGTGELRVSVVSLDEQIESGAVPVPDLIKMDIEGGEIDALAGLTRTLVAHKPIVIVETHLTLSAVDAALSAAGYEWRRLDPTESDDNAHLIATPSA